MKKSTQVSSILMAALVATGISGPLLAKENGSRADHRAEMFARLDADNSGSISAEEFAAHGGRFARLDADGDGLLTLEEMTVAGEDRAKRRAERMLKRLDANGDGALSKEEIEARHDPARMFSKLDADGDGQISEEEFAEAKGKFRRGGGRHKR